MLAVTAVALLSCVSPAALSVQNFGEMDVDLDVESERAQFNSTCKCGKKFTRIVGGTETQVNAYPWQAALFHKDINSIVCGGSLITNQHILTAAHCFAPETPLTAENMVVHLRDHDLSNPSETNLVERYAKTIHIHKHYDRPTIQNDIAIIHLNKTVPISSRLLPVCLPSSAKLKYGNEEAIATGWGATSTGGDTTNTLQEVKVSVFSRKDCLNRTAFEPIRITRKMLCAAGLDGQGTCHGDSGGPLIYLDQEQNYDQIGITSFGHKGCGDKVLPAGFTRVNKYLRWIERHTTEGVYCSGFTFP
ncbi:hypothetical protein HAZT_HAZT009107 [Hyalella azteca]|nr:hypothetical protein HAZT_HAZT009107 [Hyalella azteca]